MPISIITEQNIIYYLYTVQNNISSITSLTYFIKLCWFKFS